MEKVVTVPEGAEAWKNCNAGVVAYRFYDVGGREVIRQVPGGQIFRISAVQRQMIEESFIYGKNNIFINGTLKRVDNRIAAPASREGAIDGMETEVVIEEGKTALPEGYDESLALDDDDLLALFKKSGNAFQSAVKGLDEGRARRLLAMTAGEDSPATISQHAFLSRWVAENFVHGKTSRTVAELQGEIR